MSQWVAGDSFKLAHLRGLQACYYLALLLYLGMWASILISRKDDKSSKWHQFTTESTATYRPYCSKTLSKYVCLFLAGFCAKFDPDNSSWSIAITFCSGSTLNFQLFPPKVCIQLATALAALFADNQDLCWSFVSQIHISLWRKWKTKRKKTQKLWNMHHFKLKNFTTHPC